MGAAWLEEIIGCYLLHEFNTHHVKAVQSLGKAVEHQRQDKRGRGKGGEKETWKKRKWAGEKSVEGLWFLASAALDSATYSRLYAVTVSTSACLCLRLLIRISFLCPYLKYDAFYH